MTARDQVQALRARKIGVEELVEHYLDRIETHGGKNGLNAVCEINGEVLDQARAMDRQQDPSSCGPLFGLPILVKDNIDVAGLTTTAGSLALADNQAKQDAPVIRALRKQGALILGKTNLTEFANYTTQGMPNGFSSRGGQVRSAYDPKGDPSGSSTGSAVAVSAGLCAAALGTDTSFSIVGCATANGVFGFKPSHGALPGAGIVPIAHTLDMAGPLTRDARDGWMMYHAMRGAAAPPLAPIPPKDLRLGVNIYGQDQVSPAQIAKYQAVLEALKADGGVVTEYHHPPASTQRDLMRCEFRQDLEAYLAQSSAGPRTLRDIIGFYEQDPTRMPYGISLLRDALSASTHPMDDEAYRTALFARSELQAPLLWDLQGVDACLMTGPTNVMHFAGLPSLALPLGLGDDAMPRGMILYGVDEARLFAAALTLQRYCPPTPPPELAPSAH